MTVAQDNDRHPVDHSRTKYNEENRRTIVTAPVVSSTSKKVILMEKRPLSETMPSAKRSGGNYGSLAISQFQPTFYIVHPVECGETLQRLALKYSIHVCFV